MKLLNRKPNQEPSLLQLAIVLIITIFLLCIPMEGKGQSDKWLNYASFSMDKLFHSFKDESGETIYQIHSDNVYQIGAKKNYWIIAFYRSGHNHYFFWSDPATNGKSNRNGSGIYFQHPIPLVSKLFPQLEFTVGHRIKLVGDPIGERGSLFERWIPIANLDVKLYESKNRFSVILHGYGTQRYGCVTMGLGTSITY